MPVAAQPRNDSKSLVWKTRKVDHGSLDFPHLGKSILLMVRCQLIRIKALMKENANMVTLIGPVNADSIALLGQKIIISN